MEEEKDKRKIEEEWADALGLELNIPPVPNHEEQTEGGEPTPPPVPKPPMSEPPMLQAPGNEMPHREPMPPTYMLWAVLSTICCCMPAGVVAIIFSARVSSFYYAGEMEKARKASETMQWWIIASIVLGIISSALTMPFSMLMPS